MASDSDRMIRNQLHYLIHACKCLETGDSSCNLEYCKFLKDVLVHMTSCTEGRLCENPHCVSSREIMSHWQNCTEEECALCSSPLASRGSPNETPESTTLRYPTYPIWQDKPAFFAMWLSQASPRATSPEGQLMVYPELEDRSEALRLLLLLHHGHYCRLREGQDAAECNLNTCPPIKRLLNHMSVCEEGFSCPTPQCASARSVMLHWQQCNRIFCSVCSVVRPKRSKSF